MTENRARSCSFINVYDPTLFDEALKNKVVLCSPWTLYPVLSIIRMAIDNFILEKTTSALLPLLANFDKHWEAFNDCLERMGKKLADAQKEHEQLVTTRQRQLAKVLGQIETLRQQTDFASRRFGSLKSGKLPSETRTWNKRVNKLCFGLLQGPSPRRPAVERTEAAGNFISCQFRTVLVPLGTRAQLLCCT